MRLRNLLDTWRKRPAIAANVSDNGPAADTTVSAMELLRLGVQQRQHRQYDPAVRNLARAIELKHDLGDAHHVLGLIHFDHGRFEDAVDSFELATHFSPRLAVAHIDLAAALSQIGRNDAAESAYRRALELDPGSVAARHGLGNLAHARGELEQAAAHYRAVIEGDPAQADAQCNLAFVLYKLGRYDESRAAHAAALGIRPDFAEAHHNLGLLLLETGYPDEALASFERALALLPHSLPTRACVAHALRDLGRLDEAIVSYGEVLAVDPQFGDAVINRCYALLMRGEFRAGWEQYERRFAATATPLRGFPFPDWQGEPLSGQRILVYAEQGLGDEIMFASCLPDLQAAGAQVVLECNSRLASLFARSFPHASIHGGNKADDNSWLKDMAPVNCQVAIGSLPRHYRGTREAFPRHHGYLVADPQRTATWRDRLGTDGHVLSVGIAWRGGSLRTRQLTRSIPIEQWLPVLRQPRVRFFSLQHGDIAGELAQLRRVHEIEIRDCGAATADLDELAAAISALDLVISVDNTIVHLAGALGKDVWVLLGFSPEWRYSRHGEEMPWYPSAQLFHQHSPRAWDPVMDQVAYALEQVLVTQHDLASQGLFCGGYEPNSRA